MNPSRRPFVGGNWKMNTTREAAVELAHAVVAGTERLASERIGAPATGLATPAGAVERSASLCEVVVFPPFPWLLPVVDAARGSGVAVGAQDLSPEPAGAFTGQVSAEMIVDTGASWVIIGHSERRRGLGESNDLCGEKLQMALEAGLGAVLCVGETWDERAAGRTDDVNREQLAAAFRHVAREALERVVVAYEPVWAIGTGRSASVDDAQAAHREIRRFLGSLYAPDAVEGIRLLYGGSVNAGNARAIFAASDVDGGLIGGASLKPADFLSIVAATGTATAASHR